MEDEELCKKKRLVEPKMMVNQILEKESPLLKRAHMYENREKKVVCTTPCCESCTESVSVSTMDVIEVYHEEQQYVHQDIDEDHQQALLY